MKRQKKKVIERMAASSMLIVNGMSNDLERDVEMGSGGAGRKSAVWTTRIVW